MELITNETPAAMLLLASTVEANMRTLEAHTRSRSVGGSMSVSCDVSRTAYPSGGICAPAVRWTACLHLDPATPEFLAQGYGATYAEALADAQTKAAKKLARCPTCGHQHDACPTPAIEPLTVKEFLERE